MDLSDLFISGGKTEVQAVESLGHRANQRQSQDQNSDHLTLRLKDYSSSFVFTGRCQEKSVPGIGQ